MAASVKTVYICLNNKNQTLYNKTLGTWNDGTKGRDNSSVWTFSAKHDWTESKTIQKAIEWLGNIGHKDITFELANVEVVNGKERLTPDYLREILIRQGIDPDATEAKETEVLALPEGSVVEAEIDQPNEFLEMVFGEELSEEEVPMSEMENVEVELSEEEVPFEEMNETDSFDEALMSEIDAEMKKAV